MIMNTRTIVAVDLLQGTRNKFMTMSVAEIFWTYIISVKEMARLVRWEVHLGCHVEFTTFLVNLDCVSYLENAKR